MKNLFKGLSILILIVLSSCGEKNNLKLDNRYVFFDGTSNKLQCTECDPIWYVRFIDETTCELWTETGKSSSFPSCKSRGEYKYDLSTQTISLNTISNSNVSSQCLNNLIGEWKWTKGEFGERFYSVKNSDCDFSLE